MKKYKYLQKRVAISCQILKEGDLGQGAKKRFFSPEFLFFPQTLEIIFSTICLFLEKTLMKFRKILV